MTAEQYLRRIKKIDAMVENKVSDYRHWVEVAEGLGGASEGERVQASRNLYSIPNAICKYIDIENEIRALKQERQNIIATIEQLPCEEYELVYKYYVQDITIKELAYHFGKSYEWVKWRKRKAVEMIQEVLDKEKNA